MSADERKKRHDSITAEKRWATHREKGRQQGLREAHADALAIVKAVESLIRRKRLDGAREALEKLLDE